MNILQSFRMCSPMGVILIMAECPNSLHFKDGRQMFASSEV